MDPPELGSVPSLLPSASMFLPTTTFLRAAAVLPFLAAGVAHAQTTTLDFGGLSTADLNTGYGDYVDGPNADGFTYTGTGGFTPHVTVGLGAETDAAARGLTVYGPGYNDLVDVVYGAIPGGNGSGLAQLVVTLSADPGHLATLESFDLGNWGVAVNLPYVRVVDETGAVLFEDLSVDLNPNTSPDEKNYVLSPAPQGKVLTLLVSVSGLGNIADNVGIDNLTFGELVDNGALLGSAYCTGAPANETGHAAILRAFGGQSIAANDVTLMSTGLPLTSFGFFITSRMSGLIMNPGGSAGNLCVTGAIGRYVGPGQIQNSSASGTIALDLDLAQMPTPTGLVPAQAGETWFFQAWHRDIQAGVATSNFTEALSIPFVQ